MNHWGEATRATGQFVGSDRPSPDAPAEPRGPHRAEWASTPTRGMPSSSSPAACGCLVTLAWSLSLPGSWFLYVQSNKADYSLTCRWLSTALALGCPASLQPANDAPAAMGWQHRGAEEGWPVPVPPKSAGAKASPCRCTWCSCPQPRSHFPRRSGRPASKRTRSWSSGARP